MMRAFQKWSVVLALMISIATPWSLLQSAAWFGMLFRYSQDFPLVEAISMTFDGDHPCRICHFVREGKSQERHEPKQQPGSDQKLQLGLPPEFVAFLHPPLPESCSVIERFPGVRTDRPPTPPPRG